MTRGILARVTDELKRWAQFAAADAAGLLIRLLAVTLLWWIWSHEP